MLQISFIINRVIVDYPDILLFHVTLMYLVGFFGFSGYYLIIFQKELFKSMKSTYFIIVPVIFSLIADINYFIMPYHMKIEFIKKLFVTGDNLFFIRVLIGGVLVVVVFYQSLLLRDIIRVIKKGKRTGVVSILLIFSLYSIIASGAIVAGYIFNKSTSLFIGCLAMCILFVMAFFISLRHPKFLQLLNFESEKKIGERSYLEGLDINKIIEHLKVIMNNERPYVKEGLSLNKLSQMLSISTHQLSELLNEYLKTNFNNYINSYRVEYAKSLLLKDLNKSVLEIAYETGFNSKTSFYDAFSKFTGMTPAKYRKKNT
jgi:AraC-like DNA-binding protein